MDLKKLITKDNLSNFCATNEVFLEGKKPKGIAILFGGCGDQAFPTGHSHFESRYSTAGILHVFPFLNPWCFMNKDAVKTTDAVVSAIFDKYGKLPIVLTGGSMGGYGAIRYSFESEFKDLIKAVGVNYPVCEFQAMLDANPIFYSRILSSVIGEEKDFYTAIKENSLSNLVGKMRDIPYLIVQGDKDECTVKEKNADVIVPLMKKAGLDVTYRVVPYMIHGEPVEEYSVEIYNFLIKNCLEN